MPTIIVRIQDQNNYNEILEALEGIFGHYVSGFCPTFYERWDGHSLPVAEDLRCECNSDCGAWFHYEGKIEKMPGNDDSDDPKYRGYFQYISVNGNEVKVQFDDSTASIDVLLKASWASILTGESPVEWTWSALARLIHDYELDDQSVSLTITTHLPDDFMFLLHPVDQRVKIQWNQQSPANENKTELVLGGLQDALEFYAGQWDKRYFNKIVHEVLGLEDELPDDEDDDDDVPEDMTTADPVPCRSARFKGEVARLKELGIIKVVDLGDGLLKWHVPITTR